MYIFSACAASPPPFLGTGCFYIFSPICQLRRKATVSKQQQVSPTPPPRSVGQKRGNWVGKWGNGKRGGSRFVCVLSVWSSKMRACRFERMPVRGLRAGEGATTTGGNVFLMRKRLSDPQLMRVEVCADLYTLLSSAAAAAAAAAGSWAPAPIP